MMILLTSCSFFRAGRTDGGGGQEKNRGCDSPIVATVCENFSIVHLHPTPRILFGTVRCMHLINWDVTRFNILSGAAAAPPPPLDRQGVCVEWRKSLLLKSSLCSSHSSSTGKKSNVKSVVWGVPCLVYVAFSRQRDDCLVLIIFLQRNVFFHPLKTKHCLLPARPPPFLGF